MKTKYKLMLMPVVALAALIPLVPANAQLPPTNMGKFVHQPGDNQYTQATQEQRHGNNSYVDTMGTHSVIRNPGAGGGGGGSGGYAGPPAYICAPPPPKGPDISVEPITADEPIPQPGFPPMPMALDLPVTAGYSGTGSPAGSWFKNGGGGGGGGGNGGTGGGYQGSHQHYGHFSPGAFLPNKGGGGGGGEGPPPDAGSGGDGGGGSGGGGGYQGSAPVQRSGYRVGTPPPIPGRNSDTFAVSNGGTGKGATAAPTYAGSAPGYGGASSRDIKALGKAPELEGEASAGAPEAPSPVLVNQSRSQDLSLPDDDFVSNNFKDDKGKRFMKNVGRRGKQFGRQMLRSTGVPIGF